MASSRFLPPVILGTSLAGFVAACGGPPPPAAPTTDAAPTSSAAPLAETPKEPEKPAMVEPTKPAEAEKPAAKALPASKHTVNGVSISSVTAKDIQAVLEKAGWKVDANGVQPRATFGKYEQFSVVAYKGAKLDKNVKQAFYIGVSRQMAERDPKTADSEENFAPKKLKELYLGSNPKLVYLFDEPADALVTITPLAKGMKDTDLQKHFDQTVVKAK